MHPDDPPMSPIGGVARVFRSHEALRRLIELVPSPLQLRGLLPGNDLGDARRRVRRHPVLRQPRQDRLRPLQERYRQGARILGRPSSTRATSTC